MTEQFCMEFGKYPYAPAQGRTDTSRKAAKKFSELKKLGLIEDTGDRRDGCAVMMVRP